MRELRTYGSVGALGGQPPRATRPNRWASEELVDILRWSYTILVPRQAEESSWIDTLDCSP